MRDLIKRSLRGTLVYGTGDLLVKGASFLLIPIYTRFLTPGDYGTIGLVGVFSSFLGAFYMMGLNGSLTRFHYDFQEKSSRRAYYGTIYLFVTLTALCATLLLSVLGSTLFGSVFRSVPFHPYLQIGTWIAWLSLVSFVPLTLFQLEERSGAYRLLTISQFLVSTGLIIFFVVFLRLGALGSLYGQLLGLLVMAVPYTVLTWRNITPVFNARWLRESLMFGLPLMLYGVASLVQGYSDRFFIERFASLRALGLYTLAFQFAWLMNALVGAANLAWTPLFFNTAGRPDARQLFGRFTSYYSILVSWVALALALLSREVIVVFASPAYRASYKVVPILVLASSLTGAWFMLINQVFLTKKTKFLPRITVTAALLSAVLNMLLVPRWGIRGAAWTAFLSLLVQVVLLYRVSSRAYPIDFEAGRLAKTWAVAILVFLMTARVVGPAGPMLSVALKVCVLAAVYPVSLYAVGVVRAREVSVVRDWVRDLLRGGVRR